jgi:DNA-binding transcriptional ArsR family regulator
MVIVVVAERPSIPNEEARGAVAQPLVHLGQREGYCAHPIEFAPSHPTSILRIAENVDMFSKIYNHNVMELIGYASRHQNLDAVFAALADPTRRAILSRLAAGEASVNEIAAPFEMSQPAVSKHLRVLERAGLIERDVDKQRRPARLKAEPMALAVSWLEEFKQFWSSSFDQLDGLLEELKKSERKRLRGRGAQE